MAISKPIVSEPNSQIALGSPHHPFCTFFSIGLKGIALLFPILFR
jgi:hypothetical protein